MELDLLKQRIEMLINCGVQPDHILRDMNVLARAKEVIEERLEFIKKFGIERVMPWMIKCEAEVLGRSQISFSKSFCCKIFVFHRLNSLMN